MVVLNADHFGLTLLLLKSHEDFFKEELHQQSMYPAQNHLHHKPAINPFMAAHSLNSVQQRLWYCQMTWLPLLQGSDWAAWLDVAVAVKHLPSPAVSPASVGGNLHSGCTKRKGPSCLCPFSMHRNKRKIMVFSANTLCCELLWVRSMYPPSSLVAGDLWQGYVRQWWQLVQLHPVQK